MAATSPLRNNTKAGIEEIKEEMGGNICRCTGYQKIFDAVELARDVISGKLDPKALEEYSKPEASYLGANVKRIDAPGKVTGRLKYAADMKMTNMLHMQVFRSSRPHAKIKKLDLMMKIEMNKDTRNSNFIVDVHGNAIWDNFNFWRRFKNCKTAKTVDRYRPLYVD